MPSQHNENNKNIFCQANKVLWLIKTCVSVWALPERADLLIENYEKKKKNEDIQLLI